jgi:hypothetical protein
MFNTNEKHPYKISCQISLSSFEYFIAIINHQTVMYHELPLNIHGEEKKTYSKVTLELADVSQKPKLGLYRAWE